MSNTEKIENCRDKIIKDLNALYDVMHENQCYACSHEFIEFSEKFGTEIIADAIDFIERQKAEIVRCKDCKWRSYYCTEATDGTTMYTCHYPCADGTPRPADWFCADGEKRTD